MFMLRRSLCLISIVTILVFSVACGDDVVGDGTSINGDNSSQSGEDCPPGEEYHPIAAECVPENGGGNNDNNNTNNDTNNNTNNDTNNNTNNANNDTNNSTPEPPADCGPGAIEGQSCRPDGTALGGVTVLVEGVDCDGEEYSDTAIADENGIYNFNAVPAGDHTVSVEAGSFSGQQPVTVEAGETTQLLSDAAKVCVGGSSVEIAVVNGSMDDIGSILQGMEIEYENISDGGFFGTGNDRETFLSDLNQMLEYDIIFIECSFLWDSLSNPSVITSNIRQYVESGNSLYVSDYAAPFVQMGIPEAVEFYNDNGTASGPRAGDTGTVTATVQSPQMQSVLPNPTTDISYPSGAWAVAQGTPANASAHFTANVSAGSTMINDSPLMVSYNDPVGNGRVIFTSFHNSAQATGEMGDILEFMIFEL